MTDFTCQVYRVDVQYNGDTLNGHTLKPFQSLHAGLLRRLGVIGLKFSFMFSKN